MAFRLFSASVLVLLIALVVDWLPAQTSRSAGGGRSALFGSGTPLHGKQVIVVVPRSRDAVIAYSKITGRWYKQPIQMPPNMTVVPVVGDVVAAFQLGNEVFAFSALEGRWSKLALPPGSEAVPTVDADSAMVHAGNLFCVFSAKSAGWSVVNLEDGTVDPQSPSPTTTR